MRARFCENLCALCKIFKSTLLYKLFSWLLSYFLAYLACFCKICVLQTFSFQLPTKLANHSYKPPILHPLSCALDYKLPFAILFASSSALLILELNAPKSTPLELAPPQSPPLLSPPQSPPFAFAPSIFTPA